MEIRKCRVERQPGRIANLGHLAVGDPPRGLGRNGCRLADAPEGGLRQSMDGIGSDLGYNQAISSVVDIERAVERLSPEELRIFRQWFSERDAADWDRQLEADVASGRVDALGTDSTTERNPRRRTASEAVLAFSLVARFPIPRCGG